MRRVTDRDHQSRRGRAQRCTPQCGGPGVVGGPDHRDLARPVDQRFSHGQPPAGEASGARPEQRVDTEGRLRGPTMGGGPGQSGVRQQAPAAAA